MILQRTSILGTSELDRPWNVHSTVLALEVDARPGCFRGVDVREGTESHVARWLAENATASLTRDIEDLLSGLQGRGVRLARPLEIREYLLRFPDAIDALQETIRALSMNLPDAQLVLELYRDPEIEDEHLVVYVRFKHYPEDVMDRIRNVREKCRRALVGKKGWVHVTTDFSSLE